MAVELTNAGKMAINTMLHQAYEDMLDEKDARIAELEAQLTSPRQVGGYYIVGAGEYDAMKSRIADLENILAKDVRDPLGDGRRPKVEVDIDGAATIVKFAQHLIDHGHQITFPAACCITLSRELNAVKERIKEASGTLAPYVE